MNYYVCFGFFFNYFYEVVMKFFLWIVYIIFVILLVKIIYFSFFWWGYFIIFVILGLLFIIFIKNYFFGKKYENIDKKDDIFK